MAYVGDKVTAAIGKAFNAMNDIFIPAGTACKLLKVDDDTNTFVEIVELAGGEQWFFEYSEFRQRFVLQIAQNEAGVNADIADATHVRIGSDAVYVIERGDTIAPQANDFTWKLFCRRFDGGSRFAPLR